MARPRMWILDLDDTLYPERSYVMSALQFAGDMIRDLYAIPDAGEVLAAAFEGGVPDPIKSLWQDHRLPEVGRAGVVAAMRGHRPLISLYPGAENVLNRLRVTSNGYGIMTDGRSVTQRAKLAALGCLDARAVLISEESGWKKPEPQCYAFFASRFTAVEFGYVGDNPAKDFVGARAAGWATVMLVDQGRNVHSQTSMEPEAFQAAHVAESWDQIGEILDELA